MTEKNGDAPEHPRFKKLRPVMPAMVFQSAFALSRASLIASSRSIEVYLFSSV